MKGLENADIRSAADTPRAIFLAILKSFHPSSDNCSCRKIPPRSSAAPDFRLTNQKSIGKLSIQIGELFEARNRKESRMKRLALRMIL